MPSHRGRPGRDLAAGLGVAHDHGANVDRVPPDARRDGELLVLEAGLEIRGELDLLV